MTAAAKLQIKASELQPYRDHIDGNEVVIVRPSEMFPGMIRVMFDNHTFARFHRDSLLTVVRKESSMSGGKS